MQNKINFSNKKDIIKDLKNLLGDYITQSEISFKNEQHINEVLKYAPVILFSIDTNGIFTVSKGKQLSLFGIKDDQIVGQSIYDLYIKDFPQYIIDFERCIKGESFVSITNYGFTFETHYSPLYNNKNEIIGVIGMAIDISKEQENEFKIKKNEMILKAICDTMIVGILILKVDVTSFKKNEIVFFNNKFETITITDFKNELSHFFDKKSKNKLFYDIKKILKDFQNSVINEVNFNELTIHYHISKLILDDDLYLIFRYVNKKDKNYGGLFLTKE